MKRIPSQEELDKLQVLTDELEDYEARLKAMNLGCRAIKLPYGEVYAVKTTEGRIRMVLNSKGMTRVIRGLPWPERIAIGEAIRHLIS